MQFKEMWKAQEDGGKNGLLPVTDQMCFFFTRARNRSLCKNTRDLRLLAWVQLRLQLSCCCLFRNNNYAQSRTWENSMSLERQDDAAHCCEAPIILMPPLWLQWELRALSTLLAVIIASWLGPWTIKTFRYSHTEVMKSCKHEVLILTTVMKCDCWNIYFHFEYLSICVLPYWYAHTVWGCNLKSLASRICWGHSYFFYVHLLRCQKCAGQFMYNSTISSQLSCCPRKIIGSIVNRSSSVSLTGLIRQMFPDSSLIRFS